MDGSMQQLRDLWSNLLSGTSLESKILQTAAAVAVFALLRRLLTNLLQRGREVQSQYQIRKYVAYGVYAVAFLVVGRIWFAGFQALTTYVGLLSAGLAIALQAPLVNLAGWVFIVWRQPFAVGDRVQIGDQRGDVIDQRLFMFSLMEVGNWVDAEQSTGRIVHVPNGLLFTQVLANYSQGFYYIWNEIPVLVTFESDWRKAKSILQRVVLAHGGDIGDAAEEKVREAAKKFMIFYNHLTPVVYTKVQDSGVLLTMRYLCEPRRRRGSEQAMWEDILDAFAAEPDIDFAYPTQRLYANDREGKPATRPERVYPAAAVVPPSKPG